MRVYRPGQSRFGLAVSALAPALMLAACGQNSASDSAGAATEPDTAAAPSGELVLYTARHYDSDRIINEAFEQQTGIRIRVIEADGDLLIERVRADGARSPADVVMTVDAGRLHRAQAAGLFQPMHSEVLEARIPASLRHPDGLWFGFSTRARVLVYAKDRVDPAAFDGYASLADPAFRGRVCVRSSGNIYNISTLAALVERWGADRAQEWANGVVRNFARTPSGGDTDQIRAVAAGECDITMVNHYYLARLLMNEPEIGDIVALYWPEEEAGVHVNISGAGVAVNAPNPEAARLYLEFLASDLAQRLFAETNNEFPAVPGAAYDNPTLDSLGGFTPDSMNVAVLGENQAEAQRIFDRAGWP